MSLKAILLLGPAFLRGLRKIPNLLHKVPKTYQFTKLTVVPKVSAPSRTFSRFFGNFGNSDTLVGFIRRTVSAANAHRRPNSLLRAYSGLAGSVHLRNQIIWLPSHSYTTINKMSEPENKSWFHNFISSINRVPRLPSLLDQPSPLTPKEILGVGCNSAVWAADLTGSNGTNQELAVKVLYNYYASASTAVDHSSTNTQLPNDSIVDWILLRRQLERECTLRPSSGHPNIVPIVGQFLGRSPASGVQETAQVDDSFVTLAELANDRQSCEPQKWIGADAFPEGFGGNSYTYYLLMPRFDATLKDFLNGKWCPQNATPSPACTSDSTTSSFVILSESSSSSLPPDRVEATASHEQNRCRSPSLAVEDAVAISAQLFDAVAELESHGVAHRDIKPDNVLIRRRTMSPTINTTQTASMNGLEWLDDDEVLATNTRFHVALTDFGCAIRTKRNNSVTISSRLSGIFSRILEANNSQDDGNTLAHSGNIALLAPEIASALQDASFSFSAADYSKSDLWAMATLIYPLFGVKNPFVDSSLSSVSYNESSLPNLPADAPGVVSWLLEQCLRRCPWERPSADLVADVLHTWCILRHANRRLKPVTFGAELFGTSDEMSTADLLEQLTAHDPQQLPHSTATKLRTLLDVSWASDWLTGPARPPDGLRVSFYRRVTLNRFAHCLRIVYEAESMRAARQADRVSASLSSG